MRFEKVSFEAFRKDMLKHGWTEEVIHTAYQNVKMPERKTAYSAGYDFVIPMNILIKGYESVIIPSGIKVFFEPEEAEKYHLELHVRSSTGIRRGCVLSNGTAIVDADYYGNEDNEGDILIALYNRDDYYKRFEAGDRIMQGVFVQHGIADNDTADGIRTGGVGSTDAQDLCCNDDYCEIGW